MSPAGWVTDHVFHLGVHSLRVNLAQGTARRVLIR